IEGAEEFAMMGMIPAGAHKNRAFCQTAMTVASDVKRVRQDILFDPQTSGGLVASINKTEAEICFKKLVKAGVDAEIIGEVYENDQCGLLEII
ncbi:MAG: selenide, water dikinase SelD, partial [Desulfobacteraceae bacterium]|nr:selenide, water dikinase SelD [Desulfobacteraceae bacterium]